MLALMSEFGLWACLLLIAYVYVGYPLTLRLLPGRAIRRQPQSARRRVTVVVAAFNEARHIRETVLNKLAQHYPEDLLDVIVVSDGSSDGTDALVAAINSPRVTLLRQEPRQGKTSALNRAVAECRSEIVVFSDANSRYDRSAIAQLVEAFDDPSVGYVTGQLIYDDPGQTAVGGGSGIYMRYENWVRSLETRVGSIVGVNGGIDAVRRSLYQPMRPDHLPDFMLPLRVVAQGYRVIYCPEAVCREEALGYQRDEFRMRVRVSLRGLHTLWEMRAMLHPRRGLFAVQLLIHKVIRYLLILPLAGAVIFNVPLRSVPFYGLLLSAQLGCYALAAAGWLSGGRIRLRLVFIPFYFCLVNIAAGMAFLGFLRGERQVVWTPRKGA
jgi:cellulose synthase/poly-beta-1,6-N-acetylglucosamine synthase-like glycosyltransferase